MDTITLGSLEKESTLSEYKMRIQLRGRHEQWKNQEGTSKGQYQTLMTCEGISFQEGCSVMSRQEGVKRGCGETKPQDSVF